MDDIQYSIAEEQVSLKLPSSKIEENQLFPQRECSCPKIMAVDDDAFNLLALENILLSLNQNVETAYNGKEALDKVIKRATYKCSPQCKPYSIIFLDLNMPIMDGYECTRKLKEFWKSNPDSKSIIVACTAAVQSSERQKVKEAGMDDFIGKPISKSKINEILAKYMH